MVGTETLKLNRVDLGPPHDGVVGAGLTLRTNRGDIQAILHQASNTTNAVLWVGGAKGGFGGPAGGIYAILGQELILQGITSLRVTYRCPGSFLECVLDALAGLLYLQGQGYLHVILVGHSFGGAVVITTATLSHLVSGVVALSSQTYGAQNVARVSPLPLILIHGEADRHLPPSCSRLIYSWAQEPKELVLLPGADHGLSGYGESLRDILLEWIPKALKITA